jgi:PKD repeat protein
MSVSNQNFSNFLAVYSGASLGSLTELGCRTFDRLTFHAVAGQTYYVQVGGTFGAYGTGALSIEPAPPPQSGFYFYPFDPNRFDSIWFQDISGDPANIGIQTVAWNFGDGTSASSNSANHQYTADGDYQVTQTVTTFDGRSASSVQTVQVRTHDVAVTRVTAPNSASVGQTRSVTVNLRNTAYPETVQIDLYKSVPGGFQWVATVTRSVPALSGNRTTNVAFNYTFTSDDARNGKVTFKVIATIVGARDALPADNQAVSSPPTKVTR